MISLVALVDIHQAKVESMGCWGSDKSAGSQRPPMTNARVDRHIVRSFLRNRTTTSRTIQKELGGLSECPIYALTVRRILQQCGILAQQYYLSFSWQCGTERDGDSNKKNDKIGYKNGTMSSFQRSYGFACSTWMAVYASWIPEETAHFLLSISI